VRTTGCRTTNGCRFSSIAEFVKAEGKKAAERFERMFAEHGCHRAPRPQTEAINVRLGFARSSRWRTTIESALKIEMQRPFTPN